MTHEFPNSFLLWFGLSSWLFFLVVVMTENLIPSQRVCVRLLIAKSGPWALLNTVEDHLLAMMFLPVITSSETSSPWLPTTLCTALPRSWGLECHQVTCYNHSLVGQPNIHTPHHGKWFLDITLGKNVKKKILLESSLKKYMFLA